MNGAYAGGVANTGLSSGNSGGYTGGVTSSGVAGGSNSAYSGGQALQGSQFGQNMGSSNLNNAYSGGQILQGNTGQSVGSGSNNAYSGGQALQGPGSGQSLGSGNYGGQTGGLTGNGMTGFPNGLSGGSGYSGTQGNGNLIQNGLSGTNIAYSGGPAVNNLGNQLQQGIQGTTGNAVTNYATSGTGGIGTASYGAVPTGTTFLNSDTGSMGVQNTGVSGQTSYGGQGLQGSPGLNFLNSQSQSYSPQLRSSSSRVSNSIPALPSPLGK